ncbi:hypothetical protein [Polynucleobacter sp. Fuers-14]|uniref:hypothetical protein n=1 Tax=Polynucleobacter sp. Fuers-14 TaxID=1758364 RepID=UPI001C0DE45C|nr:hypothetical protein [Polynucleobacter sp. Fuers-14]MBU3640823.1 hypothetical protein [Polynucleobacter sp. Fuers-14]
MKQTQKLQCRLASHLKAFQSSGFNTVRHATIFIALGLLCGVSQAKDNRCFDNCPVGSVAYIYSTSEEPAIACGSSESKVRLEQYSFDGRTRELPNGVCFTPRNGIKVIVLSKPLAGMQGQGSSIKVSPVLERSLTFDVNINFLDKAK